MRILYKISLRQSDQGGSDVRDMKNAVGIYIYIYIYIFNKIFVGKLKGRHHLG